MNSLPTAPRFSPKPSWLRVPLPHGKTYTSLRNRLGALSLHTVCEEARCPNMGECWGGGTATFMILGDVCTRGCRFCAVKTGKSGAAVDPDEPEKLAESVSAMGLDYVVITSVDRDDLPDQGAGHFARVVEAVKALGTVLVEVLIPDFRGNLDWVELIARSKPEVIAHNVECVRRLSPMVRDRKAGYDQSLKVLKGVKEISSGIFSKSSIMLGLGETRNELEETFADLRDRDVDFLTLGQYLQPTPKHRMVERYVSPEEFDELAEAARGYGFKYVASGPLVRSSYRAGEFFVRSLKESAWL